MICSIYVIRNKVNNKVYIGQTWQTIKKRFNCHKRHAPNKHLESAFNKYGLDSFSIELLGNCYGQEAADYLEISFIEAYKSTNSKYGYNMKEGGAHGKPTLNARLNMSNSHLSNKIITEEDKIWFAIKKMKKEIIEAIKNDNGNNLNEKYNLDRNIIETVKNNDIKYCIGCRNNKLASCFSKTKKCDRCKETNKSYGESDKNILRRKLQYERDKEKIMESRREYMKDPKVIERDKLWRKEYRKKPEIIKQRREYWKRKKEKEKQLVIS